MISKLIYNPNSRYNNIDNTNIIFLTPSQVFALDIGMDKSQFKEDEYDDVFPFLADSLKEMVKETTLGDINGCDIEIPVENSDCKVFICIEINGKLCKLQSEEWEVTNNLRGLPCHVQVKVFQRLITEGQITLDDLAAEDIDNEVYKKLSVNDICGVQICRNKIEEIDRILAEQRKDKKLMKKKERIISNMG